MRFNLTLTLALSAILGLSACGSASPPDFPGTSSDGDTGVESVPGAADTADTADTGEPIEQVDADGDGYANVDGDGESLDCDDSDANVNPGETEVCDGIDNDCDGNADEGFEIETWYTDADEDGYGDPSNPVNACGEQPEGTVEDSTDCNDSDKSIHPGAKDEGGDGIDSDCDDETVSEDDSSEEEDVDTGDTGSDDTGDSGGSDSDTGDTGSNDTGDTAQDTGTGDTAQDTGDTGGSDSDTGDTGSDDTTGDTAQDTDDSELEESEVWVTVTYAESGDYELTVQILPTLEFSGDWWDASASVEGSVEVDLTIVTEDDLSEACGLRLNVTENDSNWYADGDGLNVDAAVSIDWNGVVYSETDLVEVAVDDGYSAFLIVSDDEVCQV